MNLSKTNIPQDGIKGLKQNFIADLVSGFIVFLLALPLSIGISKASDFPPIMGLITAIIGGMLVSLYAGSKLTIKGPAAGLIVIIAGSVAEFGGGEIGWHLSLGAMFVAALLQVIFGMFKFGKLTDIFPLTAIHGMLAAIGIIIILKQIPVMLNVNPNLSQGKSPLELIASIPDFLKNLDPRGALIGIVSLLIMLLWPYLKKLKISKVPSSLVVILFAIPAELLMDFKTTEPSYALVHLGNLVENLHLNIDFGGYIYPMVFIKYTLMFAIVGSLESLLTVKAIDMVDIYHRKSDADKDLIAVGAGNMLSAVLGGVPMISEVARSSANVANGAQTRWANFFHGFFILIFVVFASEYIELIPNAALAAMLVAVGIKLAHPNEFIHTFKLGKEQIAIFLLTIIVTLWEDLLLGIGAGMLLKIIIHIYNGVPIRALFKSHITTSYENGDFRIYIKDAAIFSNFIKLKDTLERLPIEKDVILIFENTKLIDHTVMEYLHHFTNDYTSKGGSVIVLGLEDHKSLSNHPLSAKKLVHSKSI